MSRPPLDYRSVDYASLQADLRADAAATLVRDVSEATIRSLHVIPTAERRENLLALAKAVAAAPAYLVQHIDSVVAYYATRPDAMAAFGRLMWAVRECDAEEADRALDRLVAA